MTDTITIPADATADIWETDSGHKYRVVRMIPRSIPEREDVLIISSAIQLEDGSYDDGSADEPPLMFIESGGDRGLTIAQARELAAEILSAADELERLTGDAPPSM
jgi:hypothetical protein